MSAPCPTFGFVVTVTPRGTDAERARTLADSFLRLLETNGLAAKAVRGDREYIVTREGSQATDADRRLVAEWSDRWLDDATVSVSDLIDLA